MGWLWDLSTLIGPLDEAVSLCMCLLWCLKRISPQSEKNRFLASLQPYDLRRVNFMVLICLLYCRMDYRPLKENMSRPKSLLRILTCHKIHNLSRMYLNQELKSSPFITLTISFIWRDKNRSFKKEYCRRRYWGYGFQVSLAIHSLPWLIYSAFPLKKIYNK